MLHPLFHGLFVRGKVKWTNTVVMENGTEITKRMRVAND